ncbi:MAG: hypothetical protein IJH83_03665 [Coriobacteriales bacterium]|nr:hypothetical protein [Coriobacteriales bacterium]
MDELRKKLGRIKTERAALWCGIVFCVLVGIFWFGVAHFYWPVPADATAQETLQYYIDHGFAVRLGCAIGFIVAGAVICPCSTEYAYFLADIEGERPIWSIQGALGGIIIGFIVFMNGCIWCACGYRDWMSAELIQFMNDFSWFAFLCGVPFLVLQMIPAGIVILKDKAANPLLPRWLGWFSIFGGLETCGAMGPIFFQSGPFAYHGVLAFYLPAATWLVWYIIVCLYMMQGLKRRTAAINEAMAIEAAKAAA